MCKTLSVIFEILHLLREGHSKKLIFFKANKNLALFFIFFKVQFFLMKFFTCQLFLSYRHEILSLECQVLRRWHNHHIQRFPKMSETSEDIWRRPKCSEDSGSLRHESWQVYVALSRDYPQCLIQKVFGVTPSLSTLPDCLASHFENFASTLEFPNMTFLEMGMDFSCNGTFCTYIFPYFLWQNKETFHFSIKTNILLH